MLPKAIHVLHWYLFKATVFLFRTSVSLILSNFICYDSSENFRNRMTDAAKSLKEQMRYWSCLNNLARC